MTIKFFKLFSYITIFLFHSVVLKITMIFTLEWPQDHLKNWYSISTKLKIWKVKVKLWRTPHTFSELKDTYIWESSRHKFRIHTLEKIHILKNSTTIMMMPSWQIQFDDVFTDMEHYKIHLKFQLLMTIVIFQSSRWI